MANNIANSLYKYVMSSFKHTTPKGVPESRAILANERKDSHIVYFRDLHKVLSAKLLKYGRYLGLGTSSFSRSRRRFYEHTSTFCLTTIVTKGNRIQYASPEEAYVHDNFRITY